jgi:hypothetical protein
MPSPERLLPWLHSRQLRVFCVLCLPCSGTAMRLDMHVTCSTALPFAAISSWISGCSSSGRCHLLTVLQWVPSERLMGKIVGHKCLLQVAAAAAAAHAAFLGLNTLVVHRWRLGGNDEPESYLYEGSAFDEEAHQAQGA